MLKTVKVKSLKPNPFRRLDDYPIIRLKVDELKKSIDSTGFWGTIVGRSKNRDIEIAFGHHRMIALQEMMPDGEVEIIVRDLSNDAMLRMMARENMEEWGTSAWVEMETVEAAIDAYDKGEIELPKIGQRGPRRETFQGSGKFYSHGSVAEFLGWTRKNNEGLKPNHACETAFLALDLIRDGLLTKAKLRGMTRSQVHEMGRKQRAIQQNEKQVAAINRQSAESAKKRATTSTDPEERARLEKQAAILEEQAQQHEEAADRKARDFGEEAVGMFRREEGIRNVREKAETYKAPMPSTPRVMSLDEYADRIAGKLEQICNDDQLKDDASFLAEHRNDLSARRINALRQSFTALIGRLEHMREAIVSPSRSHSVGTGALHAQKALSNSK